ncbi:DUF3304 domain-containing protein [Iodobacter arcticus]|uniref:DUF3304 domain-containing protein n=1 Tax=Iodobacter arcticus TaxID=590593 RepID=A0ABW2QUI5_9NEIS
MKYFILILVALMLQACKPQKLHDPNKLTPVASGVEQRTEIKGLGVHGYNYTDGYIDHFSVNGSGGMNLEVSDASSSGDGTVCCGSVYPVLIPYKMTVQWTKSSSSNYWCQQEAILAGPIPANPNYLNVHFYQDGHIEISVSEGTENRFPNMDRFNRIDRHKEGNVNNDEKMSRCQNGRP